MDYYELLGVSPSASDSDIKKAYRKLSFAYHPDRNSDSKTVELYKEINAAYDVLSDPQKRRSYDLRRTFQFEEHSEPVRPRHRDPRYRTRRPRPANYKSNTQVRFELIQKALTYLIWVNRVGILVSCLFFLDYILPVKETTESVVSVISHSRGGRGAMQYVKITTAEGSSIKTYDLSMAGLKPNELLGLRKTWIYRNTLGIKRIGRDWQETLYLYRAVSIFPWWLLIGSILGVLTFRRHPNFSFNVSIGSVIFLLITLYLIV